MLRVGYDCIFESWGRFSTILLTSLQVILIGNNIFTGEKVKDVIPQMDPVDHPDIVNEQFKLHSLLPDLKVKLELKDGTFREDLKLPKREMQEQIRS